MSSALPYRAATHRPMRFVPSLGWTRAAAVAIAALGAAPSARVVWDLLVDRDCDKHPTPHFDVAALVVVLAIALAAAGIKTQRLVARAIARRARVRSALGSAAFGALAVLPALLLACLSVCIGSAIDLSVTLRVCFDISRIFIPMGC